MKTVIASKDAPAAIGPYSQAIKAGGFVFVSGQIPLKADGAMVSGGVAAQTQQCLENLKAVLAAAGLDLSDVVKTTVFMTDLTQFGAMNEVYGGFFTAPCPARATIQVSALPKGAGVEIEAAAALR